jgi:hypothetical protein
MRTLRSAVSSARKSASLASPTRKILQGDLEKISLSTLLTIMDMERRSGILVVERGRLVGRVSIREGVVIRAQIEGSRSDSLAVRGAETIYQMLTWLDGRFELWETKVDGRDEVRARTTYLLMEGARRADEASAGFGAVSGGDAHRW